MSMLPMKMLRVVLMLAKNDVKDIVSFNAYSLQDMWRGASTWEKIDSQDILNDFLDLPSYQNLFDALVEQEEDEDLVFDKMALVALSVLNIRLNPYMDQKMRLGLLAPALHVVQDAFGFSADSSEKGQLVSSDVSTFLQGLAQESVQVFRENHSVSLTPSKGTMSYQVTFVEPE